MRIRGWARASLFAAAALTAALGGATAGAAAGEQVDRMCSLPMAPESASQLLRALSAPRTSASRERGGVILQTSAEAQAFRGDANAWTVSGVMHNSFRFSPEGPFAALSSTLLPVHEASYGLSYSAQTGLLVASLHGPAAQLATAALVAKPVPFELTALPRYAESFNYGLAAQVSRENLYNADLLPQGADPRETVRMTVELSEQIELDRHLIGASAQLPADLWLHLECNAEFGFVALGAKLVMVAEPEFQVRGLPSEPAEEGSKFVELELGLRAGGAPLQSSERSSQHEDAFEGRVAVSAFADEQLGLSSGLLLFPPLTANGANLTFLSLGDLSYSLQVGARFLVPPTSVAFGFEDTAVCPVGTACQHSASAPR